MKKLSCTNIIFVLAFLLIIITNAFVFINVFLNRKGEPESIITLTERELKMPYARFEQENSGVALRFDWRVFDEEDNYYYKGGLLSWADENKLRLLGFPVDKVIKLKSRNKSSHEFVSKQIFIVLEYDGKTYEKALNKAKQKVEEERNKVKNTDEQAFASVQKKTKPITKSKTDLECAQERLKRVQEEQTRIFAVDAGISIADLRKKYPDNSRYIIVKAVLSLRSHYDSKKKKYAFRCYVSKLSIPKINVPLKFHHILNSALSQGNKRKNRTPRYQVTLAFGSRLEPWVISVEQQNL